jgi:hypothetical protein
VIAGPDGGAQDTAPKNQSRPREDPGGRLWRLRNNV